MEKKQSQSSDRESHAKINLFLDILSKREDNYHNIRTIFSEVELADSLRFTLTDNSAIKILTNIDSLNNEENLVYKIAFFIKKKYNVKPGIGVDLQKKIPLAAGLGGGSSNAATTISALTSLWNLDISDDDMNEIASVFGSDINYFLNGNTCTGTGRGNIIKEIQYIDIDHLVLVNPGFKISSKEIYDRVEIAEPNPDWEKLLETHDIKYCYNNLEKIVLGKYPELTELIRYMNNNGALKVMISGSGPTIICFCPDSKTANKISKHFSEKKIWNCITKTKRRIK